MSKGKRFTEEFKLEAVKQVVERGFGVADVSQRLVFLPIACMPGLINMAYQPSKVWSKMIKRLK
jgi:hypothetical protein